MLRIAFWVLLGLIATNFVAAKPGAARVRLADGFDFPVGKPDAQGYYIYRGFRPNGHLGDDWNGNGGGNSDLKDPVYAMGHGLVVLSRDVRKGWGNCVIVRHAYNDPKTRKVQYIDSLYAHLDFISVKEGQQVTKGQLVGGIGTNRGMYDAHLHLEVRKNIAIGMNRMQFARDFSNYHDPKAFITAHRKLADGGKIVAVPTNTFAYDQNFAGPSATRTDFPASNALADRYASSAAQRDLASQRARRGTGPTVIMPLAENSRSGGTRYMLERSEEERSDR